MMNLVYLLFVCVLWNERTVLSVEYEEIQLFDTIDENVQAIRFDSSFTPKKFEGKCPRGEIFYPSDEKGDEGECDCRPDYLYYPGTDLCYDVYEYYGSPCKENQSLIFPYNGSGAICVPTLCKRYERIYDRQCVNITTHARGCSSLPNHKVWINSTTFRPDCLDLYEVQLELNSYHEFCWKGGRRWFKDKCKGKNTKPDLPGCTIGELYYPGDKPGEWRCDCKPGHIYHAASDNCYAAYTQGPCADDHHFVFPLGFFHPLCVRNRCPTEDSVFFRGACHKLRTLRPCFPELKSLGVNVKTIKLECSTPRLYSRDDDLGIFFYWT